jgi:hypothetical protein
MPRRPEVGDALPLFASADDRRPQTATEAHRIAAFCQVANGGSTFGSIAPGIRGDWGGDDTPPSSTRRPRRR